MPTPPPRTLLQKIQDLGLSSWYDHIQKIKAIFLELYQSVFSSPRFFEAGTNITFTGTGTEEDPLIINAAGGGGSPQDLEQTLANGATASQGFTIDDTIGRAVHTGFGVVYSETNGTGSFNTRIAYDYITSVSIADNKQYSVLPIGFEYNNIATAKKAIITGNDITENVEFKLPDQSGVQTLATRQDTGKKGQDTVDPSSGSFQIPHGIGVEPAIITFSFSNQESIELREYSVTKDATNITFTYLNAPAETTLTVWWQAFE